MSDFKEPLRAMVDQAIVMPALTTAAVLIEALTRSQLEPALDAYHRNLKIYENLKSQ
jgi:hypothetical protein